MKFSNQDRHNPSRREFLQTAAALTTTGSVLARQSIENRTNIIVFMADDLGYADIGSFGGSIKTPNIDAIGKDGIRFTDFYSAAPNCSPSRAALLTGRYPSRVGIYSYIAGTMYLPTHEITSASLLKKAGYQTAHIGKWHLCPNVSSGKYPAPDAYGFDHWLATTNNASPSHFNPGNFVRNGKGVKKTGKYSCQIVADETIQLLEDSKGTGKPFFLNVWFHEPHTPVAAPEALVKQYGGDKYKACIANMDQAIGRVLKKLDEIGQADNTLVVFTSDNGSYKHGSNAPFKGGKKKLYEGGIRAPTVMRWPRRINPGTVSHTPGCGVDLLPTLCESVGINIPSDRPVDGISLLPLLSGGAVLRPEPLFWFFYREKPECVIRQGDWSLVGFLNTDNPGGHSLSAKDIPFIKNSKLNRFELYHLKTDRGQTKNVSAENPEVFESLKAQMIEKHKEVLANVIDWFKENPVPIKPGAIPWSRLQGTSRRRNLLGKLLREG